MKDAKNHPQGFKVLHTFINYKEKTKLKKQYYRLPLTKMAPVWRYRPTLDSEFILSLIPTISNFYTRQRISELSP